MKRHEPSDSVPVYGPPEYDRLDDPPTVYGPPMYGPPPSPARKPGLLLLIGFLLLLTLLFLLSQCR